MFFKDKNKKVKNKLSLEAGSFFWWKESTTPSQKGFSMVETLIAVSLFSLIVVMISGAFSSFLKNYADVRRMQKTTEGAQFAMNIMAKTIRTSEARLSGTNLELYDYAQAKCLRYSYNSTAKRIRVNYSSEADPGSLSGCVFAPMIGERDLTSDNVTAVSFDVAPSNATTSGIVTMNFVLSEVGQTSSPLQIQTSVSLRNYGAP